MSQGTTYRNITYRLLPVTRAKAQQLSSLAGACRYVWNQILADQEDLYRIARMCGAKPPSVSFFTLGKAFTDLRRVTPWLQALPFKPVRHTLKYQADAWQRYFRGQGSRPRFKGRHGDDSFTIPENVTLSGDRLHVPRIGWVVLRRRGGNPYPAGVPRQAVVKRQIGKWTCTVSYEIEAPRVDDDGLAVGVDMNVGQIAVSTGEILCGPDLTRLEARRRRYQRMVTRRRKGSNRRERAKRMLARTSRRIAQCRTNWHHQASRVLANSAHTVCVEDLKVGNMTKSARGTAEDPGKNVRQKSGLNRAILGTGWQGLRRMLAYKAGELVAVDPAHTSQTCHRCGTIDARSRRSQSEFQCVRCGHAGNADVNAALNVLALGTGATGRRGALTLVTPMNRQQITNGWRPKLPTVRYRFQLGVR